MADTAALVVALSAQLTRFEKDMKAAGIMADRAVDDIEKKFAGISIKGSFLGNLFSNAVTSSIEAAGKAILEFKDRFLELEKVAKLTGESMENLWGFQESARQAGSSTEDALKGLREMANLLNQMKRGQGNSLSELLDANPQALAGFNRATLTVQETWQIVGNLVRDARSEFDKIDIARLAGFSEDMVKSLERGGAAMKATSDAAAAAAPPLQQMAEQAKLFDGYLKSAVEWLKAGLAGAMADFRRDTIGILSLFEHSAFKGGPLEGLGADTLKMLRASQELATLQRVPIPTGNKTSNVPVKPTGGAGDTASAYERQNDALEKQIGLMGAEAAAAGTSIENREALKAQSLLLTAAEKDGIVVTEAYAKEIEALAGRYGAAALQAAEAQHRIQQINQASQVLGSAVSSAFADAIIEGKKLNEVMNDLLKTLARAAINAGIMSIFTPGAGGGLSPFASLFKAAGGTDFAPGGLTVVGEKGPELVNLPRGSQVIPNDVLRGGAMGSISAPIVFNVDNRGASVEAVAKMAQVMAEMQATLPSKIIGTVQQARRSRIAGV